MITFVANGRTASYTSTDVITAGSVGIPVQFTLSEDFDGLSPIVVFEGSGTAVDVALVDNACVVPHEVVATAGGYLKIGIYARNGEGTIVIPTIWGNTCPILPGAAPSGADPSQPTPDWTAQVQQIATDAYVKAEQAEGVANDAKSAAITAQDSAQASAEAAKTAQEKAEDAQEFAETAEANARGFASGAAGSASEAADSATAAGVSAQSAANAKTAAETARGKAETAQTAAESAKTAAQTAKGLAEGYANAAASKSREAAQSAATASTKASEASASASTASGKAEEAAASAQASAGSANDAAASARQAEMAAESGPITRTVTGSPLEITDGADDVGVKQLIVNIIPGQAGEGDPSPTNIRAFSGWTGATLTINGEDIGITFPAEAGTVYAGTLDVLTGVLTVGYAIETLTSENTVSYGAPRFYFALGSVPRKVGGVTMFCSHYKSVYPRTTAAFDNDDYAITLSNSVLSSSNGRCFLRDSRYTTVTDLKAYWDAQNLAGTPVQVVYPIATPQTYQLTPQVVKTLLGDNSFGVDCGTIDLTYVADLQTYVDDEIAAATAVRDVQINGTSILQDGVANIHLPQTVTVSGTTPTIVGAADTRYICGECSTLTITVPASGCIDVTFTSGSTPTVLTVTPTKTGVTAVKWANEFDPTSLDADTVYEVNVLDGEFGVVGSWT